MISTVPDFDREVKRLAKKYKSLRTDLARFQEELKHNPFAGVEILPGVRKIRLGFHQRAKGNPAGQESYTLLPSVMPRAET